MNLKLTQVFRKIIRTLVDLAIGLIPPGAGNKVALVRMDAIGDFVLWLDAAKEFRRIYPGRPIILLANSQWSDLAERIPFWDEVWSINVLRFIGDATYRFEISKKLRREGFHVAIQPTYSRTFLLGDALIRATGASERLGSAGDLVNILPWQKRISDGWYTRLLPAKPGPLMELERNSEFISWIGGTTHRPRLPCLPVLLPLPDRLQFGNPYFIVFPGAAWPKRCWPEESFSRAIDQISARTKWVSIICGGPQEISLCERIAGNCTSQVVNLAGKTSLAEFSELARAAEFVLGNETSAIHIAAAVGTRSICILGGGHYGRFVPYPEGLGEPLPIAVIAKMECYHCNWNCSQEHPPERPVPCIDRVTVEQVVRKVNEMLESKAL